MGKGKGKGFHKSGNVPASEQAAWIEMRWGKSWRVTGRGLNLVAEGLVRPAEICAEYKIRISYDGGRPIVTVLDPPLKKRPGNGRIEHTYDNERLCLYYPGRGEWTPKKLLANTVIPWISEWLYHYETWLAMGEWTGGGEHPVNKEELRASGDGE